MILNLLHGSLTVIKNNDFKHYNQDILSAIQLYQVFNLAQNVSLESDAITFTYLNEQKELRFINEKIILSPGTVIYYTDVSDYSFVLEEDRMFLNLRRNGQNRKFLIGEACDMVLS